MLTLHCELGGIGMWNQRGIDIFGGNLGYTQQKVITRHVYFDKQKCAGLKIVDHKKEFKYPIQHRLWTPSLGGMRQKVAVF